MEQDLICPITRQIMRIPVVASDGIVYECCAIKRWMNYSMISPATRKPISNILYPCIKIKSMISEYVAKHPEVDIYEEYSDYSDIIEELKNKNTTLLYKTKNIQLEYLINGLTIDLLIDHMHYITTNAKDINVVLWNGSRLIHLLIHKFRFATFKSLLKDCTPDLNVTDKFGLTPIQIACRKNLAHHVIELLHWSVNLSLVFHLGHVNKYTHILYIILSHDPFLDEQDDEGNTPLHITMNPVLLLHGADPNIKNDDGDLPIHVAIKNGKCKMVEELCNYGSNTTAKNHYNFTPLQLACIYNEYEIVRYLLDDAYVEYSEQDVYSVLNQTTRDIIALFIDNNYVNIKIDLIQGKYKTFLLMNQLDMSKFIETMVYLSIKKHDFLIDHLLEIADDVNASNDDNGDLAHYIQIYGPESLLQKLINYCDT